MSDERSIIGNRRETKPIIILEETDFYKEKVLNYKPPITTRSKTKPKKNTPVSDPITPGNENFSLEDLADRYRISGVSYRNKICQVDIGKTLLPPGTQEEYAQRRIAALTSDNDLYAPSFPLLHAPIAALYQNKDGSFKDQIEEARAFLAGLISNKWITTLTRIKYMPAGQGQDIVIHNYKQPDSYEIQVNFIGPDGIITDTANTEKPLQALLDTKQTLSEIDEVYKWFRNLDSYIWRVDTKPERIDERVARFDADSDGSGFGCGWRVGDGSCSSLGVRAQKIL